VSKNDPFIADQRGAVAFEMPFVFLFLIMALLLPLADVAIAGFQYISAWQALRAFGQSILYVPPPDVTNASAWTTDAKVVAKANANTSFPITNIQLFCGDTNSVCSAGNFGWPRYISYTTTVTLAPMVLRSVLCTSGNATCTLTLPYSEQFQ
jgi:Flp pilus assembly protein TadG